MTHRAQILAWPLAALLTVLLASGTARAQVPLLVVDAADGPGAHFTDLGAAVAAAGEGHTLLVRAGTYAPFVVQARSLTIVAEQGAEVQVRASLDPAAEALVVVRGLAPGQVVVLDGLDLGLDVFGLALDGLLVDGCAGQVWFQDGLVQSGNLGVVTEPRDALRVRASDQLMLVRSEVRALSLLNGGAPVFAAGLRASDSRVLLWACEVRGDTGGPGVVLEQSRLFASGSALRGGAAHAEGGGLGCSGPSVDGGPGLVLEGAASVATLVDTALSGGGESPLGCTTFGPDALVGDGTLLELEAPQASFVVDSPLADGGAGSLRFEGRPDDLPVILLAQSGLEPLLLPPYLGVLTTGAPLLTILPPLPASGELTVPFVLGDLLPPGTADSLLLQGALIHPEGGALLADPAVVTIVDG